MSESGMAVISAKSPARTIDEATKVEVVLGSTGSEGDTAMLPRMLNEMFHTKFKLITAYKGQPEVVQAVQKGELDGLFMSGWSGQTRELLMQMFQRNEIGFMVQMSFKRDPDVGDVPTIMELVTNDDDRQVMEVILGRLALGRPFVAPPGVPADRVKLLRDVFMQACADPGLVLEGDKMRRYIQPIDGETTQKMIEAVYKTSPEVIAKIRTYVKPPAAQ
jgi:tripartite-type tricarboxylate transporter receptor subunit TctC